MKTMQAPKKNTVTSKTKIADKNLQEKSCGISQTKDGVIFTAFYPEASSVQLAGDFNDWQPEKTPMKKISKEGVWNTKLRLTSGTHSYRFVVDGHWQQDPCNDAVEPNSYGEYNSVVNVI